MEVVVLAATLCARAPSLAVWSPLRWDRAQIMLHFRLHHHDRTHFLDAPIVAADPHPALRDHRLRTTVERVSVTALVCVAAIDLPLPSERHHTHTDTQQD